MLTRARSARRLTFRERTPLLQPPDSGKPLGWFAGRPQRKHISATLSPAGKRAGAILGRLAEPLSATRRARSMRSVQVRSSRGPDQASIGDLSLLARGGVINLAGGAIYGVLGFLVVTVVARGLAASGTGLFFEGVAVFNIATYVLMFGADVGLIKFISAHRATGLGQGPRRTLAVALVPAGSIAVAAAVVGWMATPRL